MNNSPFGENEGDEFSFVGVLLGVDYFFTIIKHILQWGDEGAWYVIGFITDEIILI